MNRLQSREGLLQSREGILLNEGRYPLTMHRRTHGCGSLCIRGGRSATAVHLPRPTGVWQIAGWWNVLCSYQRPANPTKGELPLYIQIARSRVGL